MQFIFNGGNYCEYRGYIFCNGKPTNISDTKTITLLLSNPKFERIKNEAAVTVQEVATEATPEKREVLVLPRKAGRPRKVD